MTDTKDKREIEKKMRDNFDSLKRDEFMSLSEYLMSPIAVRDLQKKAFGGRVGLQNGGEPGFLEKILGENIADKIDRGFVSLLGGSNLLGPSLSDYDDAVQQLEEMGMSAEDIIDMLGPRPETREERLNQKFKAEGGRIGFQKGRRVQPVEIPGPAQEMEMLMKRLMEEGGLSREDAEKEAERLLFGPSAMKLKDSKRGLGSMMASADDEVKDPSDMLTDDAMDMLQTDPFELLKDAVEKGTIAELPDSDIYSMYDAAVERGAFDGTFEEFKAMLSQLQRRRRGPEGIMQTMVT